MSMLPTTMNFFVMLGAAVCSWLFGAMYYGSLGKQWVEAQGSTVEEFRAKVAEGTIKHVGLPESVAMVADALGLPVDQITETIEPKVATERIQTEFLTVEPAQAAGVHQIARGLAGGKELIHMELQMYVGAKDPADTVTLTGHPTISLTIPGGSHGDIATASVAVNSIPVILDAPAGLRTAKDLPIGFFSPNAKP